MHLIHLSPRRARLGLAIAVLGVALAACQSPSARYSELLGQSQAAVQSALGVPFAEYALDDGTTVWFYDTGERILQRERVHFDAQGQVIAQGPAWTREAFSAVEPGVWQATEVLQHFGPPVRQRTPRASILGALTAQDARSTQKTAEDSKAVEWIYGFREFNRYYVVAITIEQQGQVSAVDIREDEDANIR